MNIAQIPSNLNDIEPKLFLGLSKRQAICLVLGLCLGISSFIILKQKVGTSYATIILLLLICPLIACGFVKKDGLYFEEYIANVIRFSVKNKILIYRNTCLLGEILDGRGKDLSGKNNEIKKNKKNNIKK